MGDILRVIAKVFGTEEDVSHRFLIPSRWISRDRDLVDDFRYGPVITRRFLYAVDTVRCIDELPGSVLTEPPVEKSWVALTRRVDGPVQLGC